MEAPHTAWPANSLRAAASTLSAFAAVFCLSMSIILPAVAKDLDAACEQTGPDKRHLECDVRFHTPPGASSATATVVETNRALSPNFEGYPKADDISAFLFLFDLSDPARADTVKANAADALRILATATPHDKFGVATLPGNSSGPEPSIDVLAPIGNDLDNIKRQVSGMKAKGPASPIYRSSIEGIRLLKNFTSAKRRALLLFSDGKAEDKSYTIENVVADAQKAHVTIFTFGIAERPADKPFLQPLMRLEEDTDGHYIQADPPGRHFAPAELDTVLKYVDNGARVGVDLTGVASDQTVELAFATPGDPKALTYRVPVQGLAAEAPQSATPSPGWFDRPNAWISAHWIESILALIAVVLLLVALVILGVRAVRRRRRDRNAVAPSQAETYHFRSGEAATADIRKGGSIALATLQPVFGGGSPHAVRAEMVTIGRASDCDIRLDDETISARHATLVRKRDGSFELIDMNSRNGVRVNSKRVDRQQRVSSGDTIQFGRAQFRFVLNEAVQRAS